MKTLDITLPAARDALQRLLDRPEVTEVRISRGPPVEVGVCRGGPAAWFSGASLFQALERAESALTPRVVVEEEAPGRLVRPHPPLPATKE